MLEKQIAKILREIADRLDAGTSGLRMRKKLYKL